MPVAHGSTSGGVRYISEIATLWDAIPNRARLWSFPYNSIAEWPAGGHNPGTHSHRFDYNVPDHILQTIYPNVGIPGILYIGGGQSHGIVLSLLWQSGEIGMINSCPRFVYLTGGNSDSWYRVYLYHQDSLWDSSAGVYAWPGGRPSDKKGRGVR